MVRRRRERGYSLVEVTVMLAVFGAMLAIFFILTSEMRQWEKRLPVNYMRHPQVTAVLARLRRDVVSAAPDPYPEEFGDWKNTPKTLIIETLLEIGGRQTIVWDFSRPTVVTRHAYTSTMEESTWVARGLPPDFSADIDSVEFEGREWAVRIMAKDSNGQVSIDQIYEPRVHDMPPPPPPATPPAP